MPGGVPIFFSGTSIDEKFVATLWREKGSGAVEVSGVVAGRVALGLGESTSVSALDCDISLAKGKISL